MPPRPAASPATAPWRVALAPDGHARLAFPVGFALVLLLAVWASGSSFLVTLVTTVAIESVAAMSLTVLVGWAGQAAVMTAALLLLGGYAAYVVPAGFPGSLPLDVLLALGAGAVLGVLSGLPSRRMTGMYLLLGTLAVQFAFTNVANVVQSHQNATAGYAPAPPDLFGLHVVSQTAWLFVSGAAAVLTYGFYRYLSGTRLGRNLRLISSNRSAADISGIRSYRSLVVIFAITSAITAAAGALLADNTGNVSYDGFGVLVSVSYFVMIVIGGLGSLGGAVFGTAFVVGVPAALNLAFSQASPGSAQHLAYGEVLVYVVVSAVILLGVPGGAGGMWRSLARVLSPSRVPGTSAARPAGPARTVPAGSRRAAAGGVAASSTALLSVEDVSVRYGAGEPAVEQARFEIEKGECMAVLGRNGAGKTSLLYAIAGFPPGSGGRVSAGEVWLRGRSGRVSLAGMPCEARARAGASLVPAEDKVFPSLTVLEQLHHAAGRRHGRSSRSTLDAAFELFPDLEGVLDRRAGVLSGGQRQQLALACALLPEPDLLLVDELSLGLSPVAIDRLVTRLAELRGARPLTMLVVEQNLGVARRLADRLLLMDRGRIVGEGDASSSEWAQVVEGSYLGTGRAGTAADPVQTSPPGDERPTGTGAGRW
ncbi:MAG: ATP-binding cassette domain-containing protein [Actinomycetota bacterium]|jgi:ABC-type branched-subunit amino acid transport system ATPase component/ABC-type branched-subunit amino acid transport system permease subunit|nr:ATP-binding cassette domain-containing protein [Actinomycetota bacterium]MDA8075571.1 ATP-binding cassette domain-containing protein [Actinomycetota bacterium]